MDKSNVSGHQVGRKLHAVGAETHHGRQGVNKQRLAQARQTHQKRVASRQHRRQCKVNNLLLAN